MLHRAEWIDYEHRQRFEHELIDRKTNWMLATQTILFAAYVLTFAPHDPCVSPDAFRAVVARVGALMSLLMWIGVLALINSKRVSFKDYRRYFDELEHDLPEPLNRRPLQWGVRTLNTWVALVPDLLLPIVFLGAWLALLFD